MTISDDSGPGHVRIGLDTVFRSRMALDARFENLSEAARGRLMRVHDLVSQARSPNSTAIAAEVADTCLTLLARVASDAGATGTTIDADAYALLDLLARKHGHEPLEPYVPPPRGSFGHAANPARFPPGFARDYATDVIGDLRSDVVFMDKFQAAALPQMSPEEVEAAVVSVADTFPDHQRDYVRHLLSHPRCHAVEAHGPQVTDEALLARLCTRRPPDVGNPGADAWEVKPSGKVTTTHVLGASAVRFASAEAMAKPLRSVLDVAARDPGGLDGFLTKHEFMGITSFYVSAAHAGLGPGDTSAYRAAGAQRYDSSKDWLKARDRAIKSTDATAVGGVRTDVIADGADPGAWIIFERMPGDDEWILSSCYAADRANKNATRLEKLA